MSVGNLIAKWMQYNHYNIEKVKTVTKLAKLFNFILIYNIIIFTILCHPALANKILNLQKCKCGC